MNSELIDLIIDSFIKILIPGITMTIPLTIVSFLFALIIAVITAMVQHAKVPILKNIARVYIWIIRGTPLLVQLYIIFFGLPSIGIFVNAVASAIIVFSINEGAYCAETIRAAIEAIPNGQIEAGYCSGMNYIQIMWHVALPQAFKNAFPTLFNSLISLVKDTSLAANITVVEMFMATQRIAGRTYKILLMYIIVAFIYLMFSTILTWIQRYGENKLAYYGGRK